ncbi:SNF2 helicase associated domain-containing protein, partial [Salmonella enterica]|uniref:SNF2 helicase associated domain-containing protein n=1 Tax=Salmonella enterica TaxID=28901 RepID=UPI001F47A368
MMKGYELTEFISKVFPVISSLFSVSLDEDVRRLVFIKEMQPQVYLDYKNEALTIQPVFKYGDIS